MKKLQPPDWALYDKTEHCSLGEALWLSLSIDPIAGAFALIKDRSESTDAFVDRAWEYLGWFPDRPDRALFLMRISSESNNPLNNSVDLQKFGSLARDHGWDLPDQLPGKQPEIVTDRHERLLAFKKKCDFEAKKHGVVIPWSNLPSTTQAFLYLLNEIDRPLYESLPDVPRHPLNDAGIKFGKGTSDLSGAEFWERIYPSLGDTLSMKVLRRSRD